MQSRQHWWSLLHEFHIKHRICKNIANIPRAKKSRISHKTILMWYHPCSMLWDLRTYTVQRKGIWFAFCGRRSASNEVTCTASCMNLKSFQGKTIRSLFKAHNCKRSPLWLVHVPCQSCTSLNGSIFWQGKENGGHQLCVVTETEVPFWRNFRHWLHWKLSK